MRKRNVHIQFWLDKKEAEAFQKKVKKSGLSREAYLRHLVNGLEPQDAPPPDYYAMMRELHGIGNNLNQIAAKAHVVSVLSKQEWFTKQSEGFVEETFNGSLPQFLVAFTRRKKLSKQEIAEIQKIIDQNAEE